MHIGERQTRTRQRMKTVLEAASRTFVLTLAAWMATTPAFADEEQTSIGNVDVVHGTGAITVNEQDQTTLTSDGRVIYEWDGIQQHADHTLEFDQSGDDASALNRGRGQNAFEFFGTVTSNGQVIFANESGVFFKDGSSVIVPDLIAAAGQMTSGDFESGTMRFTGIDGEVVNEGTIQGLNVALLGEHVANHGDIYVEDGQLLMLAGDAVLIREHGSPIVVKVPFDDHRFGHSVATTSVENTGLIDAGEHGRVRLAAADGLAYAIRNRVVDRVAQSTGVDPPASGVIRAGTIEIEAGDGSAVEIGGVLDATREGKNAVGGDIDVFADRIVIADDALIDATGAEGGGQIRIGGDERGQGDVRRAKVVFVSESAQIRADADYAGDGGRVIVWSDGRSLVHGQISARGGEYGGDGGFVETSGAVLNVTRAADVSARAGRAADTGGQWLIDPYNVIIGDFDFENCAENVHCLDKGIDLQDIFFVTDPTLFTTAEPSLINASVIEEALTLGSSIFVTTSSGLQGLGDSQGNIIVRSDILPGEGADENTAVVLRLSAANHIVIEEGVQIGGDTSLDAPERDKYENLNLGVQLIANDGGGQEEGPTEPGSIPNEFIGDVVVRGQIHTNRADLLLQGMDIVLADTSQVETGGGGVLIAAIGALIPDTGELVGGGSAYLEGVIDTSSNLVDESGELLEGGALVVQARYGLIPQEPALADPDAFFPTPTVEDSFTFRGGSISVTGDVTLGRHEAGNAALELEAIGGNIDIESDIDIEGGNVSAFSTRIAEDRIGLDTTTEHGGRVTLADTGSITTGGGDVAIAANVVFGGSPPLSNDAKTRVEIYGHIDTNAVENDADSDGLIDTLGGRVSLRAEGFSPSVPSGLISIKATPGELDPFLIRTGGGNIDLNLELDETGNVSDTGTAHASIEIEASIDAGLETGAELDIILENAFFGAVFIEGTGDVTFTNGASAGTTEKAYQVRGEQVALRSANRSSQERGGRGDLEFVSNGDGEGPEVWARDVVLNAGVESQFRPIDELSKIIPGNVQIRGRDGATGLESLVYGQNASFAAGDILDPSVHFDSPLTLDGFDYTIQSLAGSVTVADADRLTGSPNPGDPPDPDLGADVTIIARDDVDLTGTGWDDAYLRSLQLLVDTEFTVGEGLADNASAATRDLRIVSGRTSTSRADLRIEDGVTLDAVDRLELHAAASPAAVEGDVIFGTESGGSGAVITLKSHDLSLQAGTGGGERQDGSSTNRVIAGPESETDVTFALDLDLDPAETRRFSLRQEASFTDTDVPEIGQFEGNGGTEIGLVTYALRSDSGSITLGPVAAQKLAHTDLALLAEDEIAVDMQGATFAVRSLDVGSIGAFQVTQELVDQFGFAAPNGGVSPKMITFRSGVGTTGDLTFENRKPLEGDATDTEPPLVIKADEIRLVASDGTGGNGAEGGGIGSQILVHDLVHFQHTATDETTTVPLEAFSFEQDTSVFVSIDTEGIFSPLPDITKNFAGVAPNAYGVLSSDGTIQISLDEIPSEDAVVDLLLPLAQDYTVLSANRVVLFRQDGVDLDLTRGFAGAAEEDPTSLVEVRANFIALRANDASLSETDPVTGLPGDRPEDLDTLAKVLVNGPSLDEGLVVYGFGRRELDDRTSQPVPELLDLTKRDPENHSIPFDIVVQQDHTILSGDLLELDRSGSGCGFGRGPECEEERLRTFYTLVSNHGDVQIRPDRINGAHLLIQVPIALQDDEIKSTREILFHPDVVSGPLTYFTSSFEAATDFGWQVDAGVHIQASDSIILRAGGSGRGDLGFAPGVRLQAENIRLEAAGASGRSASDITLPIVDARTNDPTFDFLQPDADRDDSNFDSFTIVQDGWVNDAWADRPQTGPRPTLPLPGQIENAGLDDRDGAEPLKLFGYTIISNRRGITINDLEDVKARRLLLRANVQQIYDTDPDNIDRPGLVLIDHTNAANDPNAPKVNINFETAFGPAGGFERVGISGDSIQLKAGAGGIVDASGLNNGAIYLGNSAANSPPLEFIIEQDQSFLEANSSNLPASFQFLSGVTGVEYTLRLRDFADAVIEIGSDMAERLRASSLKLEARDKVSIEVPAVLLEGLALTSLDIYEIDGDGTLTIEIGDVLDPPPSTTDADANATLIETAFDQNYQGEVHIEGNVEFRGEDITFTKDVLNLSTEAGDESGIDFLTRGTVSFAGNVGCDPGIATCVGVIGSGWTPATTDDDFWFDRFRVRFDSDAPGRDALAFVGDGDQDVYAIDAQIFEVSPSADIENLDAEVLRVSDVATLYKVDGDFDPANPDATSADTLTFYTRDQFRIGTGQKISSQGNFTVHSRDRIAVGDIAALDILLEVDPVGVDAPGVIEIQRRPAGNYIAPDGRILKDAGISFVTNAITLNGTTVLSGEGKNPSLAIEDPRNVTDATLAGFTLTTIDTKGSALNRSDFEWQIAEPPAGLPALHAFGLPRNDISQIAVGPEVTPSPLPWMVDEWRVADARRLRDLAVRPRERSVAEWHRYLDGAGIIDEIGSGTARRDGLETVAQPRLLAQDAQRSIELYEHVFGEDGVRAPRVRAVLADALERYQRSSGSRRVVGFEFRRYVKNRPNSLFDAFQIFEDLDQLFAHHRALGLTPGEYRPIQARWLVQIQPNGISVGELSEAVHPSRYVRGTDILEIFGD